MQVHGAWYRARWHLQGAGSTACSSSALTIVWLSTWAPSCPPCRCRLSPPARLQGSAVYAPEKDALVWKIKNFPGGREFLLRCKFGLPSVAAEEEQQGRLPPIKVKFEVCSSCGREGAHTSGMVETACLARPDSLFMSALGRLSPLPLARGFPPCRSPTIV